MPHPPGATSLAATTHAPVADLVLEGGGVKGVGLVGAVGALADAGWSFARIAGTSAGAVVGAVLAAMQQRGEPLDRLDDIARSLDYRRFRDRGGPGHLLDLLPGPLGLLADAVSVVFERGAYEGDYLHDWVAGVLGDLGVHTFGDLLLDDPGADGRLHHRYRLVVVASDLSRRRVAHLPWDYDVYGLDPDEQPVADAVRASASIPYFFEPVELTGAHGTATLVDGGLVSNYPIAIFDRLDEEAPRWPTVGIRLAAPDPSPAAGRTPEVEPVSDPVHLGVALVETAIEGCQAEHLAEPCNVARSVHVDTSGVSSVDFGLTAEQQRLLLAHGRTAAQQFLQRWDFQRWLHECRGAGR